MDFSCGNCSAEYRVEDSKIGSLGIRVNCKKCGNIITVHLSDTSAQENISPAEAEIAFGQHEATLVMESSDFQDLDTRTFSSEDINDIKMRTGNEESEAVAGDGGLEMQQVAEHQAVVSAHVADDNAEHTVVSHFDPPTEAFTTADFESMQMRAQESQGNFVGQETLQMPVGALDTGGNIEALALASLGGQEDQESSEDFDDASDDDDEFAEKTAEQATTLPMDVELETRQWYVAIDGEQIGPMLGPTLQARWLAQEIDEESLVWSAGMADWVPVAEVPVLAAYLGLEAGATDAPDRAASLNLADLRQQAMGGAAENDVDELTFDSPIDGVDLAVPETYGDTQVTAIGSDLSDLVQEEIHGVHQAEEAQAPAGDFSEEPDIESGPSVEVAGLEPSQEELKRTEASSDASAEDLSQGWVVPKKSIPRSVEPPQRLTVILFGAIILLSSALIFVLVSRPSATDMDMAVNKRVDEVLRQLHNAKPIKPIKSVKKEQASQKALALEPIVEKIEASQNALTLDQIISTVKDYQGDVQICFNKSYGRQQIEGGSYRLTMDWLIGVNGRVSEAKIKGPDKILVSNIPACVSDRMLLWQFPPAKNPSPVSNFSLGPIVVP
ncbi:MAG: GYF domain-containing protein [Myxococcota bacterium]|jgi:predicted Zn finger-like uncharacterized protein|nr:GYF domain-containing protein [Myxococcota bacterium]